MTLTIVKPMIYVIRDLLRENPEFYSRVEHVCLRILRRGLIPSDQLGIILEESEVGILYDT